MGRCTSAIREKAPASVIAKLALEQAIAPEWVDQMFEEHRQRQYSRELLFSTFIKLVSLFSLGLKSSLHAAARQLEDLPVSLAALYDKISRTEPELLRALIAGSAQRLAPTIKELGCSAMLPGWDIRVVNGNHLASTEKRLGALRLERGAARPGFSVVVYDPDLDQVIDLQACEDVALTYHLLSSVQRLIRLFRHGRPCGSLLAFAPDDLSTCIRSITGRPSLFPHSFTRSTNSLLYSSPAEIGSATGLPCSTWISERVGLLDFAGGTTSTRGYR